MKKQVLYIIVMLLMAVSGVMAQAPNWAWAKSFGGVKDEYGTCVATDSKGNVYIGGSFESPTISFGTTILNNHAVGPDCYVTKLDHNGNVLWSKLIGSNGWDEIDDIAVDKSDNVFVAGSFESSNFDIDGIHLDSTYYANLFIAKINSNGNTLWAKTAKGGVSSVTELSGWSLHLTVDNSGDCYIAGAFRSDSLSLGNLVLVNNLPDTNGYSFDIFIAKISSSGSFLWAKSSGGLMDDYPTDVTFDGNNSIYLSGNIRSSIFHIENYTFSCDDDFFLAKYDLNGNNQWVKKYGGTAFNAVRASTVDKDGNVILGGITMDQFSIDNFFIAGWNSFIAKINPNGNAIWAKPLYATSSGNIDIDINKIATDNFGNFYLNGLYYDYAQFDTFQLHAITVGSGHMFIVKYDSSGKALSATSVGGHTFMEATDMTIDALGSCYFTGDFDSTSLSFGNITITNLNPIPDNFNTYLAKINGPVGIEELPTSSITLSPNPTTGIITITGITQPTVAVYNLMGQKVVAAQGSNEVNLAQLPSGMYMVQVFNKDGELVKSEKVILNR